MGHTPGPWKLEAGRNIVTENGTFYITYGKDRYKNPLWKTNFSELDANAHLIAAATDLLAELKRCLIAMENRERAGLVKEPWEIVNLQEARKALSKATGGDE